MVLESFVFKAAQLWFLPWLMEIHLIFTSSFLQQEVGEMQSGNKEGGADHTKDSEKARI